MNYEIQGKKFEDLDFSIIDSKELIQEEKEEDKIEKIDFSQYNNFDELEKDLNWKYENEFLSKLPIKTTVSVLKSLENQDVDFFSLVNRNVGLQEVLPKFLQDEKITAGRVGTLTHLVLQKIDFNNIKTENDVKDFIQELVSKNFIKFEEAKKISSKKIFDLINSDFALNIKKSKKVYKERPFCLQVPASKILKNNESNDKLLVQGIIDMYYEKENGGLVLIDYKTDFVEKDESELIEKYRVQLELYKEALEKGTNKKVEEIYIFPLYLNKDIKFEI